MTTPPAGTLPGTAVVELRAATEADAADLFAALDDERVWAAGYGGGPAARWAGPGDAARFVAAATDVPRRTYLVSLAGGDLGPPGTVVGTSSLGEWDLVNERVHLGWTAYAPRFWGSPVNPATKLALLEHAFDDCGFGRVKIQTDLLNIRSQAAITRLGATREGVLRRHQRRADGTWRDTVVFSVLREEWPAVRAGLLARLG